MAAAAATANDDAEFVASLAKHLARVVRSGDNYVPATVWSNWVEVFSSGSHTPDDLIDKEGSLNKMLRSEIEGVVVHKTVRVIDLQLGLKGDVRMQFELTH